MLDRTLGRAATGVPVLGSYVQVAQLLRPRMTATEGWRLEAGRTQTACSGSADLSMAEATSTPRGARGSYANLICLHCRSRKIKCLLPDDQSIQPSDSPQAPASSCQRCRNLGLDCVVQRTILGRPAAKRRRDGNMPSAGQEVSPKEAEEEVKDYLVTELQETSTPTSRDSQRPTPDTSEIFKTMVSPTHLASVLLANDRRFGVSIPSATPEKPASLSRLVSSGMAGLLDEK